MSVVGDVPQWKRDLIARLRHQNKKVAAIANGDEHRQYSSVSVQSVQPPKNANVNVANEPVGVGGKRETVVKNGHNGPTMVQQERTHNHDHLVEMVTNGYHRKDDDSDNAKEDEDEEEDLHYGPGIVNKLKNKYLSLALRESVARPSILQMRKATSLENLLDEDTRQTNNKHFLSKLNGNDTRRHPPNNRYRHAKGHEMKRARSVEAISTASTADDAEDVDEATRRANRQSLHEETLVDVLPKTVNRPKRVRPLMSETEKPPTDLVRQAKMIFEKRPEQRTRPPKQTGEVAAKVDSFNTIIVKAKVAKKVQLQHHQHHVKATVNKPPPPLPPPPPALIVNDNKLLQQHFTKPATEKPPRPHDLPKPNAKLDFKDLPSPIPDVSRVEDKEGATLSETPDLILTSSPLPIAKREEKEEEKVSSPAGFFNENVSQARTPTSQQLKIEVNGHAPSANGVGVAGKLLLQSVQKEEKKKPVVDEIARRTADRVTGPVVKRGKPTETTSNTAVFNFTSRRDVPDYIANDVSRSPSRPELPKPGEGGIILLDGATILESFTDEDEEVLKSLEGPPSPCDVTFINDNILIDGKSSLSQKTTKQAKLRISFLDGPEVYEYPSETSMMTDEMPEQSLSQVGHTVPNLGGSSLANYTPKGTEEFHPGITRTLPPPSATTSDSVEAEDHNHRAIEEAGRPFSEGHNADMLF